LRGGVKAYIRARFNLVEPMRNGRIWQAKACTTYEDLYVVHTCMFDFCYNRHIFLVSTKKCVPAGGHRLAHGMGDAVVKLNVRPVYLIDKNQSAS